MAAHELTYWDYVKAAFHLRVPLRFLGEIPLNKLAFAGFCILGFGHPAFWLLGLAFESAYLINLPGSRRFQNVIRGKLLQHDMLQWTVKRETLISKLDKDHAKRYQQLLDNAENILKAAQGDPAHESIDTLKSTSLDQLSWIFLRLLVAHQNLDVLLSKKNLQKDLENEIAATKENISKEPADSTLSRSLKGTLEIEQRRLENIVKAQENKRVTEAELDRIEKQVTLLVEELAVSGSPETISVRIDGVMQSLGETTRWMSENADLLETVSDRAPVAN